MPKSKYNLPKEKLRDKQNLLKELKASETKKKYKEHDLISQAMESLGFVRNKN